MRAALAAATPTVDAIFNSIDTDRNGSASSAEIRSMCGRARVNPFVVNQVTTALMDLFDMDKSGGVSGTEFKTKLKDALFAYVTDANGNKPPPAELPRAANEWFDRADANHNSAVTADELKPVLQREIERAGQDHPAERADAAARIGVYLIDRNASGAADRTELSTIISEVLGG